MKLTIYQKSVYRLIVNATMILRSIGKTYKSDSRKLKHFKKNLFKELEKLVDLMDKKKLKNKNVLDSIILLASKCKISIGQSQKSINVILKYHYFLNGYDEKIKKELDCPLDSIILSKIGIKNIRLSKLYLNDYLSYQGTIKDFLPGNKSKLDFDINWDIQNLKKDGLL